MKQAGPASAIGGRPAAVRARGQLDQARDSVTTAATMFRAMEMRFWLEYRDQKASVSRGDELLAVERGSGRRLAGGLMPAFVIGLYNIWDLSWRPRYRETVDKLVAKHGGRYVARTSCPWEVLEGTAPDITNITMIEFPSMEHARAWYNDPQYAPHEESAASGISLEHSARRRLDLTG